MHQSILLLLVLTVPCLCQRPFYAGSRPIGYPEVEMENRFGDNTDKPLPPQLNGDKEYADRLDKLPLDQRPFWYLNKDKYDELMANPQTYPQRPSVFNQNNKITK